VIVNWFNWLTGSATITALSLLLALIGVVLSIVFYARSRRLSALSYAISTTNVIAPETPAMSALSIHYDGQPVRTLSVSSVSLWNSGTDAIASNDISRVDPLAISTTKDDVRILDAAIEHRSNETIDVPDLEEAVRLVFAFEFLNPGDGCIVRVIHTGTTSADLRVRGGVKAVRAVRRIETDTTARRTLSRRGQRVVLGACVAEAAIAVVLVVLVFLGTATQQPVVFWLLAAALFVAVVLTNLGAMTDLFGRRPPRPFDTTADR
jgi:hypothetical protein